MSVLSREVNRFHFFLRFPKMSLLMDSDDGSLVV